MCRTYAWGAVVDVALTALADEGVDAELRQFDGVEELREVVDAGEPVILLLRHPGGGFHAVVACEVALDTVTLMDPDPGDYRTLPIAEFEALWCRVQNEGLMVGTRWRA